MSRRTSLSEAQSLASYPQFRQPISRHNTTITDGSAMDVQSVPTFDHVSTAKPSVAMSDKLWTQIDVLDDVKLMAEEIERTGGFFNEDFSNSLTELKESQGKLLQVMSRHQVLSDRAREKRIDSARQSSNMTDIDDAKIKEDQERTKERMSEFFDASNKSQAESDRMKEFDELSEYVDEVRLNLDDVGTKMDKFDQVTKNLW